LCVKVGGEGGREGGRKEGWREGKRERGKEGGKEDTIAGLLVHMHYSYSLPVLIHTRFLPPSLPPSLPQELQDVPVGQQKKISDFFSQRSQIASLEGGGGGEFLLGFH